MLPANDALPVTIGRYSEIGLYLLVLTGFGTLASTGALDFPAVLLVGTALLFRGYLLATRRTLLIPESWTTALTLAYVVFYLADYFVISRTFLNATVHLVLFAMVVRLFTTHRDRDSYFLAVISFLMVLASAVLTVDSTFLFTFAGFMLMAVVTFILMEMRHASGKATVQSNSPNDGAGREMAFSLAGTAPALVFFILLGAAGIFFVLPRISSGYLGAYATSSEISTGFSDRVQLGRIGEIQQSSTLVMHIQIDDDRRGAFDLKWRGIALNMFDGRTWFNPHEQHLLRRSLGGMFILLPAEASREAMRATGTRHVIHYRVLMEPVASNVFFLAPTPKTLEGNYRTVATDAGGGVFDRDPEHPISSYEATSDIAAPSPAELRAASGANPPEIMLTYLQLPSVDPRIGRLAEQITASAGNSYDKASAIETYLRTKYGYTLQLPRTVARDPLANFLFERKLGHCEYFASAMAVMLRTLRIPSRVVNGFRTGEFNDLTSQYLVRASNAHSWVEAYFPGYGWVSFDPTPAAVPQTRTGWGRVSLYVDAMASFWREWVVNYDARHQSSLGHEATRNSADILRRLRIWARLHYDKLLEGARRAQGGFNDAPKRWSIIGAIAAGLMVLAANGRRLWRALQRRQLAARPEKSPRLAATIWYERMLRKLAQRGWQKLPAQTPAEFVACVQDEAMRKRVAEFTRRYEQARFGDSPDDAGRLPELYEEISGTRRR